MSGELFAETLHRIDVDIVFQILDSSHIITCASTTPASAKRGLSEKENKEHIAVEQVVDRFPHAYVVKDRPSVVTTQKCVNF